MKSIDDMKWWEKLWIMISPPVIFGVGLILSMAIMCCIYIYYTFPQYTHIEAYQLEVGAEWYRDYSSDDPFKEPMIGVVKILDIKDGYIQYENIKDDDVLSEPIGFFIYAYDRVK